MAAEGIYSYVFDGSICGHLCEIERRPYHRNCGCALHQAGGGCPHRRCEKVSFPMRRCWSEGTLGLAMSAPNTLTHSPTSSPASASAENSLCMVAYN